MPLYSLLENENTHNLSANLNHLRLMKKYSVTRSIKIFLEIVLISLNGTMEEVNFFCGMKKQMLAMVLHIDLGS